MARYRKKTSIVEAVQFSMDPAKLLELSKLLGSQELRISFKQPENPVLIIQTSGGLMNAKVGDYIVRSATGDCYPLKPEAFAMTYDPQMIDAPGPDAVKEALNRIRYDLEQGPYSGLAWAMDLAILEDLVDRNTAEPPINYATVDPKEPVISRCPNCGWRVHPNYACANNDCRKKLDWDLDHQRPTIQPPTTAGISDPRD